MPYLLSGALESSRGCICCLLPFGEEMSFSCGMDEVQGPKPVLTLSKGKEMSIHGWAPPYLLIII
jgi:hypothetical protein